MASSRPDAADAPEEELVRRGRNGDLDAFARIVRLHHAGMTRVALVITGDLDAAVAATGAAWPVAWQGLGRRRRPSGLGPWLGTVVAGEAVLIARRGGVPGAPDTAPAGGSADDALARALAALDPDDRAILALRHVGGLSTDDLRVPAGDPGPRSRCGSSGWRP